MDRRAGLLFVALGFAWGIPYLLIKVSVEEVSPAFLVLARTVVAAALLLPIAHARGMLAPVLRRWRPLLAYAVIEVAVPWILLGTAEQRLPSSTTGLLIAAVPLAGVVVALLMGSGERLGRGAWVGLLAGLLGVAALVGFNVDTSSLGAVLEVLVVVVGYAVGPALLVRYLADEPGVGVIAVTMAMVAVIYVPIVVAAGALPSAVPSAKVIVAMVVLGVVCTAGAFLMLFTLVGMIGAVRATAITYVNPAVAIVAGVLFLGETITVWTVVGFALVLVGSYFLTRPAGTGEGRPRRRRLRPSGGSLAPMGRAR